MKYVSEADLRAHLINDGCDDGCGYLDERDIPSLPWIELDEDEKQKVWHWIDFSNGWMCSCCKSDMRKDIHYCPSCGEKIVGESQKSEE